MDGLDGRGSRKGVMGDMGTYIPLQDSSRIGTVEEIPIPKDGVADLICG